jgi:hypothetical protein
MVESTHLLTEEDEGWHLLRANSGQILADFWGPKRHARNWELPDGPIKQVVQNQGIDRLANARSLENGDLDLIVSICNGTLVASVLMGRRSRSYEAGLGDFGLKLLQMGALLGADSWAFRRLSPSGRRVWMCLAALSRELERPGGYTLSDLRIMGRFVSTDGRVSPPGRDAARSFVKALVGLGVLKPIRRRGHQPTYSYRNQWVSTLTGSPDADLAYAKHLLNDGSALVRAASASPQGAQLSAIAIGCYYLGTTHLPRTVRRALSVLLDSSSAQIARQLLKAETRGIGPGGPDEPRWLRDMSSAERRPVLIVDAEHFLRGDALKPGQLIRGERAIRAKWRAAAFRAVGRSDPSELPSPH